MKIENQHTKNTHNHRLRPPLSSLLSPFLFPLLIDPIAPIIQVVEIQILLLLVVICFQISIFVQQHTPKYLQRPKH